MGGFECASLLENQVKAAIYDCCDPGFSTELIRQLPLSRVLEFLGEDARSFAAKDPAAHEDVALVVQGYTSFKAILHYRLAHWVLSTRLPEDLYGGRTVYANVIANRGKLLSGAEINPGCVIGRRFILDHGYGTVIGETAVIGDDCYLLGGVILGATGIAGNPDQKRHPVLGDRVQVGAFARVFGRVVVGSDVFIGPHCVITEDVPSGNVVTVKSQQQVMRRGSGYTHCSSNRINGQGVHLGIRERNV